MILIVGQAPSRARDGLPPLSGRSGARIAGLAGILLPAFLSCTARVNLLDAWPGRSKGAGDLFPLGDARAGARCLLPLLRGREVVLLGRGVATAFGLRPGDPPPLAWVEGLLGSRRAALCPHPSGVSRWWNDPANVERAAAFWRDLLPNAPPER